MDYTWIFESTSALLAEFQTRLFDFFPRLAAAVAILILGLILARVARGIVSRLISNIYRLVPKHRPRERLRRLLTESAVAGVIAASVFWILVFFFLTAATEALGMEVITAWLSGVMEYLPKVLTAVLIGFTGFIAGGLLRDIVAAATLSMGVQYGEAVGKLTHAAILVVSLLIAVDLVGIDISLVSSFIVLFLGAVLLAAAMSFALGARTSVSNILAAHYLQKVYSVGQTVEIGEVKGEIVQILPTALLLKSSGSRILVPAKAFNETVSVMTPKEF
jgi:hypothetical protein